MKEVTRLGVEVWMKPEWPQRLRATRTLSIIDSIAQTIMVAALVGLLSLNVWAAFWLMLNLTKITPN